VVKPAHRWRLAPCDVLTPRESVRVTGLFTVEAVPSPTVKPLTEIEAEIPADESITRSGETLRVHEKIPHKLLCL